METYKDFNSGNDNLTKNKVRYESKILNKAIIEKTTFITFFVIALVSATGLLVSSGLILIFTDFPNSGFINVFSNVINIFTLIFSIFFGFVLYILAFIMMFSGRLKWKTENWAEYIQNKGLTF